MPDLGLVTYCGLYCGLCAQRGRIPCQARALKESMAREGYEYFGHEMPGFGEFWRFLADLGEPQKACPGCRQGGGYPPCEIRTCAREANIEICAYCQEYPCGRITRMARTYPTLVEDGKRLREIGVEAWIEEQERRARTGFAYADIRNPH